MTTGNLLFQQIQRHILSTGFHRTATDGTKNSALIANQHLGTGASGRRTAIRNNGYQNGVQLLFHFI